MVNCAQCTWRSQVLWVISTIYSSPSPRPTMRTGPQPTSPAAFTPTSAFGAGSVQKCPHVPPTWRKLCSVSQQTSALRTLQAWGVWIDPNEDGRNYVWRLPWSEDIRTDLVSFDNPQERITNSDLELAALVLQEATFPFICPVRLGVPRSLEVTTPLPWPGPSGNPPPSTRWWRTSSEFGPW